MALSPQQDQLEHVGPLRERLDRVGIIPRQKRGRTELVPHPGIEPEYSAQTFKHILVPVWLLAYTYGASRYQVVVNGYTAAIAGQYPKSPWKILFVTVLVLVVVLIVMYASQ